MSNVEDYVNFLESRIRLTISLSVITFSVLVFLALLVYFLNRKLDGPKKTKFKTQKKALEYRKKVRKDRIMNIIMLALMSILGYLSASMSITEFSDCSYDIEHSNYITYNGDIEVTTECVNMMKSYGRKGVMTFYVEGHEVVLGFDLARIDLPEGTYKDMTVVYSGRSRYLLSVQKFEE